MVREKSRIFSAFLGLREGFFKIKNWVIGNYAVLTTPSRQVWETRKSLSTTSTFKSGIRKKRITYSKALPETYDGGQVLFKLQPVALAQHGEHRERVGRRYAQIKGKAGSPEIRGDEDSLHLMRTRLSWRVDSFSIVERVPEVTSSTETGKWSRV